ncbi:MAG TPA: DUF302 domain-containing protein [Arthrobacter sp.]|jgi:uncharacterized protein (DUF302 family)
MKYTHTITVPLAWKDAVRRTREALAGEGFGILSEIDVRSTFAAKLGPGAAEELGDYVILGACNPALARRALSAEPDMGALLPCNVVVRQGKDANESIIQAIDPQTMAKLSDSPEVQDVANDADVRLRAALAFLGGGTPGTEAPTP